MNKEIKYLLEEIKDTTNDYVGTNGCLYQDLLREELNLLLNYISNLEQQCKKQKEIINKATEYIKERFYFNEETGEYALLHTFDKCNAKELLDILNEVE